MILLVLFLTGALAAYVLLCAAAAFLRNMLLDLAVRVARALAARVRRRRVWREFVDGHRGEFRGYRYAWPDARYTWPAPTRTRPGAGLLRRAAARAGGSR